MIKLVNNNSNLEKSYTLSIQLSLDGFSFCVYNHQQSSYTFVKECLFSERANSPETLLEEVKKVFHKEELLHQKYEHVQLIHHNEMATFVPKKYFSEDHLKAYLKYTVKVFGSDYITHDAIDRQEIENVYIPFVNVNNYLFEYFGSFDFYHSSTLFINNLLDLFSVTQKEMFINVYKGNYHLTVIENNKIVLINHFSFKTKEDFVYYILFCAEQLKMDANEFKVTLFGEIEIEDPKFLLLYKYVRNVKIFKKLNPKKSNDMDLAPQKHFNLLHQNL